MHFLLIYKTAPDYLERRGAFRARHLALAWESADRGELLLGGAAGDPIEGSILLFTGDTPALAERFARADPYVINGLILDWRVLPWTTVVGAQASKPIRP